MSKKHINLVDVDIAPLTIESVKNELIHIGQNSIEGLYKTLNLVTAMNIYKAYTFAGPIQAGVLAASSSVDGVLSSNNVSTKNYVSLSSFWVYVAWKAINQIQSSDKIPTSFKTPLKITAGLISAGMVYYGPDFFAPKNTNTNTLGSLKLMAGFFDKNGDIPKLEEKFKEGYIPGITHAIKNFKQLLSNKFILNTLKIEGLDLAKLIIVQKFFQYLPSGKIAAFFATKQESWASYLIKSGMLKLVKEVIEIIHTKQDKKLKDCIKIDIEKQVGELALKENNTQIVIELGEKVNRLPSDIESINNKVTQEISSKFNNIIKPFILPYSHNNSDAASKILDTNASLFLLDSLINTFFTSTPTLVQYIKNKFYPKTQEAKVNEDEDGEIIKQKFGNIDVRTTVTPSNYTYNNIQEISKLGGNKFMLNKLLAYIEKNPTSVWNAPGSSSEEKLINIIKSFVEEFLYAGLFKTQNISQEEMYSIEENINILKNTLGFHDPTGCWFNEVNPKEVELTLTQLKEKHESGPKRELSNDMSLSVQNYHLKKKVENQDMLKIEKLEFAPGEVYAITGKIGTGKTTILTDIAKCLDSAFSSEGTIFYPTSEGKECKLIFCGTVPFSPPATTLLERLTYRLPSEYVSENKNDLLTKALGLFHLFNQKGFTEEKLLTKGNDDKLQLSTGQGKMVMLINAILYKQYLNKPVLFVMDETLANIDIDTTALICKKIKDTFNDSIVISVDHNAEHNGFYNTLVNLAEFSIENEQVDNEITIIGEDN